MLSPRQVFIQQFEDQLIRMALGKAANGHFSPNVHTGKLSSDKVVAIKDAWVKSMSRALSGVNIVDAAKYTFKEEPGDDKKEDEAPILNMFCTTRRVFRRCGATSFLLISMSCQPSAS